MDYTTFEKYPINILGIDESYNDELIAIETLVKSEIEYSGEVSDIESVLPYFVFFKFCEDKSSQVTTKGESAQVSEMTVPSILSQVRAWNIGAKMLLDVCAEKSTSANLNYQSQRELI